MTIKSRKVECEFKEMLCKCDKGVYRLTDKLPIEDTNPKQWRHRCTSCGVEVYITAAYPLLVYKERDFMLADSLRFERHSKKVSFSK